MPPQPNPFPNPLPPLPTPLPSTTTPNPHPHPRGNVVTAIVTQDDSSPSSTATASSTAKAFPIAVAIPALIGGMVLAVACFGIYWVMSRRRRREKRRRWEAHQKKQQRKRANTNASSARPSISTRGTSPSKPQISEKEHADIPPVPVLAKVRSDQYAQDPYSNVRSEQQYPQSHDPYANEKDYGHSNQQQSHVYPVQPSFEPEPEPASGPEHTAIPALAPPLATLPPPKPKKAASRMAAAENAAASAQADPLSRYQPKKPSPLALKAAADREREAQRAYADSQGQETLTVPGDQGGYGNGGQQQQRQTSGEWGVALGSPTHDGSFSSQQQSQQHSIDGYTYPERSRYSNDPYLAAGVGVGRGVSGQYSTDPYAVYHGHPPGMGESERPTTPGGTRVPRGNWV